MLSLQIDHARIADLEPWHAEELAAMMRAHGADFYDWLPWEGFEQVEASRRMAHRLGFTHEGTLRETFPVGEERHDLEVWALLSREWHGLTPRPSSGS